MIHVVTWLWGDRFPTYYVDRLARGLKRHLSAPHAFTVLTDRDQSEFDGALVRVRPLEHRHAEMRAGDRSCFRRLALHGPLGLEFGQRVLQLDLDTVIVGDVTPLFDRDEPVVAVTQSARRSGAGSPDRVVYNPSATLFTPLVWERLWSEFDAAPQETWLAAKRNGWSCSDMAVINYFVSRLPVADPRRPATWGPESGMVAYWRDCANGQLPAGARMVHFYGMSNPHDADVQRRCPWVAEHWR